MTRTSISYGRILSQIMHKKNQTPVDLNRVVLPFERDKLHLCFLDNTHALRVNIRPLLMSTI